MTHLSPRRLALGAGLAVVMAGAVPAFADAASTCTLDPTTHRVTVNDGSGSQPLRITRSGQFLAVQDGSSVAPLHFCDSSVAFASVTNTDRIIVNGTGGDSYVLDYSQGFLGPGFTPETDGVSEIEVQVRSPFAATFSYVGGSGSDTVRTLGNNAFRIGADEDVDANVFDPVSNAPRASQLDVSGGPGSDFVSGRGLPGAFGGAVKVPMFIHGDGGDDTLVDGLSGDFLFGDGGNDTLFAADGTNADHITGGADFDTVTADQLDGVDSSEAITRVGKPRVAKAVVSARPGKVAHVSLGWTHPRAWKELRKLSVGLFAGAKPLGTIDVSPAGGRLTARGALKLARGSKVGHHGKTVTASLALRVPRSLAGQDIRIAVTATDRHGNRQAEPELMTLRIAR